MASIKLLYVNSCIADLGSYVNIIHCRFGKLCKPLVYYGLTFGFDGLHIDASMQTINTKGQFLSDHLASEVIFVYRQVECIFHLVRINITKWGRGIFLRCCL